jgi:sulfur relay (sulfurtransferase) complex TusBCD TusD component (DsrE family)
MKIAIVIYSNDSETVWNAFRFANTARAFDNQVDVFLLGKGVEVAMISTIQFDVMEQINIFHGSGGQILCCGVCCETRSVEMPYLLDELTCETGSMRHLYGLISEADKVLTF